MSALPADEVDDLVRAEMARQQIPGCALAVVQSGRVVKAAAYGVADVERAAPTTTETVFRLQSVSKQFTAAGIMLLAEDGRLGLDDPVARHLDGCPPAWEKLTIRHLLTQTSGLPDFINEPTYDLRHEFTEEQSLAAIATRPLKFVPGDEWSYSNTNYHLLALVIRRITGDWYGNFLAARIFTPLGMTRTAVLRDREPVPNQASGYSLENGARQPASKVALSVESYGGGGVRSTVLDLAKWDAALHAGRILKPSSLQLMWTPVTRNNGATHGYGFGWEIDTLAGHRHVFHAGRWLGFSAHYDRFLNDGLTVIVLTNLAEANPARLTRAIATHYLPALAQPRFEPIPDTEPEVTARFTDLLRRCAEGKLREAEFSPDLWPYLQPHLGQLRRDMAAFGPIEKFTLVERTESDGVRRYRYHVRFRRTTLRYQFALTPDDRIAAFMPERIDE